MYSIRSFKLNKNSGWDNYFFPRTQNKVRYLEKRKVELNKRVKTLEKELLQNREEKKT